MSRWRSIWLVAKREILERGRSRAFLISLGATLAFLLVGLFLPTLIGGGEEPDRLGVAGEPPAGFETGLMASASAADVRLQIVPVPDAAAGEQQVQDETLDALLVVPATPGEAPTFVVREQAEPLLSQLVGASLSAARIQDLLLEAGVDPAEFAAAAQPPSIRVLDPPDEDQGTAFLFANVGVILLFIAIFTFGTWVLTGVVEEKQSRVVEVVLSTVEARDLLIGKVLGIGLLGLFQLVVMVAVGLGAAVGTGRITLPETTAGAVIQLGIWFSLGYVLYSTALGVLGALASRMEEATNASSPVSFVAMGAYFFSLLVVLDDPSGMAARIGTFIPPVAPMVVPLRAALGAIEPWEIVLAIAITLVTIWVLFVVGARVYSGAVLQTGARMRLRDAWRSAGQ